MLDIWDVQVVSEFSSGTLSVTQRYALGRLGAASPVALRDRENVRAEADKA